MSQTISWSRSEARPAGIPLQLARAGAGRPVLVLHHDTGMPERLEFTDALAARHDVVVPFHPGFGVSARQDWMRHPRDLAVMYQALLADLGGPPPVVVGLGFGGWIAAELASMAPAALHRLVLVGPMGIKPPPGDTGGDIMDQALVNYIEYARAGFSDQAAFDAVYGAEPSVDQLEQWDICREMSFRIAWKPYMFSHALPHLLGGIRAPSLVVAGAEDRVVPVSAAEAYAARLPGARLEIIAGCGHCVDMEQPARLARLVNEFIG